jgi:hypothetical protein
MPVAVAMSFWAALPVTVMTYRHHVACVTWSGYCMPAASAVGVSSDFGMVP